MIASIVKPFAPVMTSGIQAAFSKLPAKISLYPLTDPSKKHFMYGLIKTHMRVENSAAFQATILDTTIQRDFAEMDRLEKEKTEKVLELTKKQQTTKSWGLLSNTTQYATSTLALALSLASNSGKIKSLGPMLLLASGIIGLSNRIFHDTGVYKTIAAWATTSEALQEKLALQIEMGASCLSFGLGLSGGLWSSKETIATTGTTIKQVISKLQLGAGLGKAGTEFYKSTVQKQTDHAAALLQVLSTKITGQYQKIRDSVKDAEKTMSLLTALGDGLKQAIEALKSRN